MSQALWAYSVAQRGNAVILVLKKIMPAGEQAWLCPTGPYLLALTLAFHNCHMPQSSSFDVTSNHVEV